MNISFLNIMLCYYLSLEVVLQGMAKNNPTEKQTDAEIQATIKYAPAWKLAEEKMWNLSLQITKIKIFKLRASKFVFFWIIFCFKVFVADFEHIFV